MHPLWRLHGFVEHAIHAETDFDIFFVGLYVDVRSPVTNRLGKELVDHLDNRGFPCHLLEVSKVGDVITINDGICIAGTGNLAKNLL